MRALSSGLLRVLALGAIPVLLWTASPSLAATVTIVNMDGAGEGFNDPTPAAPVGGNPGTTLGGQRLFIFQYAAHLWGLALPSSIEIRVRASFDPLYCTATSAVLGSAGPIQVWRDFTGAPRPGTWYAVALANKLAGADLGPGIDDIEAQFNSSIGQAGCLTGRSWYYGVDGNEGSLVELLPVVLHEMGHGLGFLSLVSLSNGEYYSGYTDIYTHYILDTSTAKYWEQMVPVERMASAVNGPRVVWDGPAVTQRAPQVLGPAPVLVVNSPPAIAGTYAAGSASFGPPLTTTGVTGDVVLADDGVGNPANACEPLVNAAQVSGKIALMDRGACTFATKVKNAQNAGAIAAIVADSLSSGTPIALGGSDPTITIPAVGITLATGNLLKSQLGNGVNVTLRLDPTQLAGADAGGRVLLFAPNPVQGGSSISHFDVTANPNLLMEPSINTSLHDDFDLTIHLFQDIGWFIGSTDADERRQLAGRLLGSAPNPASPTTTIRFTLPQADDVRLDVYDIAGRRVARVFQGVLGEGAHAFRWEGKDDAGQAVPSGVYVYELRGERLSEKGHMVLVR